MPTKPTIRRNGTRVLVDRLGRERVIAVKADGVTAATRPRIEVDYEEVERLASVGLTQAQIAECIGMAQATFEQKVTLDPNDRYRDPELRAAWLRGKAAMRKTIANSLFTAMQNGSFVAGIYLSKVHMGWHEDKQMGTSPQQLAQQVREEMKKLDSGVPLDESDDDARDQDAG